ncbi:MAG: hypothetical protein WCR36_06220 [Bacteroidaceae bacterium]
MDINKILLTDEQIKNLPLFFKIIYYNHMVDPDAENRLMKYNNNIQAVEMRHYTPNRKLCLPFDITEFSK